MKPFRLSTLLATTIVLLATPFALAAGPLPAGKNWAGPARKIYAQQLSDQIMKEHPELISVTLHGVPPDAAPKTYTMYAGSFPERAIIANGNFRHGVRLLIRTGARRWKIAPRCE